MCSNCSGDYEDPDVTQWEDDLIEDLFPDVECGHCGGKLESPFDVCHCWTDRESTEQEALGAIDLEAEQEMREALIAAITREEMNERALKIIRKAAVSQNEEGGFIGQHLRDRGILP